MKKNNFIVTRFPPGAAGRFFSCCLQLSPSVSSWNVDSLELDKSTEEFFNSMIDYFNKCFPKNVTEHLKNEPDIPYICDFYSGTYERGNDVSYHEYIEYQKLNNNNYFFEAIENKEKINLILHKSKIPKFLSNSIVINIVVDSDQSHDIISKLLWLKHYKIIDSNTIDKLTDNPETCNIKRKDTVKKYVVNSIIKVDSIENFYQKNVYNNEELIRYKNVEEIVKDPTNIMCTQEFVNFSDILDPKKCLSKINEILFRNNLNEIANNKTFSLLHNNWLTKQNKFLKSFKI